MKLPYELFETIKAWIHARARYEVAAHAQSDRHPGYPTALVDVMRKDVESIEERARSFFAAEVIDVPAPELPAESSTETTTEISDEPAENPPA